MGNYCGCYNHVKKDVDKEMQNCLQISFQEEKKKAALKILKYIRKHKKRQITKQKRIKEFEVFIREVSQINSPIPKVEVLLSRMHIKN